MNWTMLPQWASSCECKALLLEEEGLTKTKNQRELVCKAGEGKLVPRKRSDKETSNYEKGLAS